MRRLGTLLTADRARPPTIVYQASDAARLALTTCFHSHFRIWRGGAESGVGTPVVEEYALWISSAAPLPSSFSALTFVAGKLNLPTTYSEKVSRSFKRKQAPSKMAGIRSTTPSTRRAVAHGILSEREFDMRFGLEVADDERAK